MIDIGEIKKGDLVRYVGDHKNANEKFASDIGPKAVWYNESMLPFTDEFPRRVKEEPIYNMNRSDIVVLKLDGIGSHNKTDTWLYPLADLEKVEEQPDESPSEAKEFTGHAICGAAEIVDHDKKIKKLTNRLHSANGRLGAYRTNYLRVKGDYEAVTGELTKAHAELTEQREELEALRQQIRDQAKELTKKDAFIMEKEAAQATNNFMWRRLENELIDIPRRNAKKHALMFIGGAIMSKEVKS